MASQESLKQRSLSLKIGDTVLLYYNAEKRASEGAQKSGYVVANFSSSSHNSVVLHPAANSDDPQLPNIHFATFKVLAANKYEAQVRYHNELLKHKRKATIAAKAGGLVKANQPSPQLAQAKRDLELELRENRAKQERRSGEAIYYGESVQLQHALTKKYVAVSNSDTSLTENTKLRVYLEEEDGRGCIFRILPRYKVQSVGEEVHYSDQVKLESVATEGQFLHCSKKTFGDSEVQINVNKECYEVNLAATDSPLTLIKHYQPSPKALSGSDYQTLRGGGIVRFFHRTHECYIVAEGSFAGKFASKQAIADLVESHSHIPPGPELSLTLRGDTETEFSTDTAYLDTPTPTDENPPNVLGFGSHIQQVEVEVHVSSDGGDSELECPQLSSIRSYKLNKAGSIFSPESSLKVIDRAATLRKISSLTMDLTDGQHQHVVTENVHFRKRRSNHGILKNPSTSANTYWQIEKCLDSRSGEPLIWDESCRIKHLPTRMYLAVEKSSDQYQPTLTDAHSPNYDQLTVFKLFPVIHQKGGQIYYDSYARLKHVHTDTWLHLNKDKRYTRHGDSEFSDCEESSIDSAELFKLLATRELSHDDAYTLELVDEDLIANFNHVAGITSVVTNQLKECLQVSSSTMKGDGSGLSLPHHMSTDCRMKHTLTVLTELERFLTVPNNPRDRKNRQKLFRNLKVLELIIYLLELHQDIRKVMSDPEVCRICFSIISKYLEGQSRKNKNYVTQIVGFLFSESVWNTHLGEDISAEKLLIALVKDNPDLLLPTVGEQNDGFVKQVGKHLVAKLVRASQKRSQGALLLRGLSVLCECQGAPIQQNQTQILKYLQRSFQHDKEVFHLVSLRPTSASEIAINIDELQAGEKERFSKSGHLLTSGEKITFSELRKVEDRDRKIYNTEFEKAQLQLFITLCKGNNTEAIKSLQGEALKNNPDSFGVQVSFPHIMEVLRRNTEGASIKSIYVELLQVLYVDVDDNRPFLDQLSYSFVLKDMTDEPFASTTGEGGDAVALTKVRNDNFPEMKKWIEQFFDKLQPLAADQQDENLLIAQVFRLLAMLVSFGYYDEEKDVKELLPKIITCLDGEQDVLTRAPKSKKRTSKYLRHFTFGSLRYQSDKVKDKYEKKGDFSSKERFKNKPEFQTLFFVKKCAMEVLDLLLNFCFYKRLHCFILDFKLLSPEHNNYCTKNWHFPVDTKDTIDRLKRNPSAQSRRSVAMDDVCLPVCTTTISDAQEDIDLDLPCDCQELVETARSRLHYIFEKADGALQIEQDKLAPILLDLAAYKNEDLVQGSFQLLDKLFSSELHIFQRAVQAQLLITKDSETLYEDINKLLHSLRKYLNPKTCLCSQVASQNSEESMLPTMVKSEGCPLKKLTEKCWLEGEAKGFEPHQQNQLIIYNFGILSDALTFMQAEIQSLSSSKSHVKLTECFHFLQALACKNPVVQKRLLQYVSLFLKASGHIGSPVGTLLKEVFSGGPTVSLKIKEEQVVQMMHLVFARDDRERANATGLRIDGKMTMILALQELAKVQELDLPLRFNQALIMKHFSHMREDNRYLCRELLAEGKKAERLELLTSKPDESAKLQLLLMMTDLLASCAEGENSGTESVCCTVYSLEELIKILSHDEIPLYRKRPFTRFLVWVYMNSGRERATENITQNEELWRGLWKHLENVATLVDAAVQHMPSDDDTLYLTTKSLLISAQWKFAHQPESPEGMSDIPVVIASNSQSQASIRVHLPDILLYLGEALLQFVVVFYTNVYQSHSKSPAQESTSRKLFTALLKMCKPLSGNMVYFGMEVQIKLYRRAVHVFKKEVITRPCGGQHFYDFKSDTQGRVNDTLFTTARRNYNKCYKKEKELNEQFNVFVANYQLAYQGPNTLKEQIGANVKKASKTNYSDFLDREMRRPGCEHLPLGQRFQDHVKRFIKAKHSTSIDVFPVTERLIKQLEISLSQLGQEISEAERARQVQVDIKSLQILRAIIYNQIVQIDPELKEREPFKYREQCETKIHPVQKTIQNYDNAVSRLMPLLSHPCEEIVYEVLALLKVLLECGNKSVQTGLTNLISAKEHRLFPTLQRMLKQSAVAYRESQFLIAKLKDLITADRQLGLSWDLEADKDFLQAKKRIELLEAKRSEPKTTQEELEMIEFRQRNTGTGSSKLKEAFGNSNRDALVVMTGPDQNCVQQQRSWASTLHFPFHRRSRPQRCSMETKQEGKRVPFLAVYDRSDVSEEIGKHAASILQFQDLKHIELAMEVLGLMCDGQYREMQNYLREQKESINSVNMVGEVAVFLQQIFQSRDINPETVDVLHQLLQTLIEMSVGNYTNQEVIFNKQIMSIINHILQLDITNVTKNSDDQPRVSEVTDHTPTGVSNPDALVLHHANLKLYQPRIKPFANTKEALELRKKALDLKGSAVELLEAMLEETNLKTKRLALQVAGGLDVGAVQGSMIDFDHLVEDDELKKEEYDDNAERALYRSYHILKRLEDYGVKELKPDSDDEIIKVWKKCERESKSVEVVYKNADEEEILTKVHFQFNPKREFKEEVTSRVKWNVDRSSHDDKLRDFLDWKDALKKDTFHQEELQKHKLLKYLLKGGHQRYILLLLLTLVLNLFTVIGLSIPTNTLNSQNVTSEPAFVGAIKLDVRVYNWYRIVLYVLGSLHLVFSIWMVAEYFLLNWKNFVLPSFVYSNKFVSGIRRVVKPYNEEKLEEKQSFHYKVYSALRKPKSTYSDINIFGLRTIYVVVFLCCSIFSLVFYGLFYSVCLLYIVVNNDLLQRALQSVTKNGKSLLWIAALILAILFIYAVISFIFLDDSVHNREMSMFCENLGQCFVTVLRLGLIESLGSKIQLQPNNFQTAGVRVLFDVSFFIIVTTIALSIVFGIIVDTFSELRDEKFNAEKDMKSVCFICGIESHEFDKIAKLDRGFKKHVRSEHNMWMYVYYSIYLDQIDTSDHNAIEKYAYEKMKKSHIDYFPIKRAIALSDKKDEEKMEIDELKSLVQSINDRFAPLEEFIRKDHPAGVAANPS